MNDGSKLRTPGKLVFERHKPKLTLVPQADTSANSVVEVEFSPEVKEMQQQRRLRPDNSDTPDAA